MKAYTPRIISPFFIPGTPVVALEFKYASPSMSRRRHGCRGESLADRFRLAPGALTEVDPRIFARIEARSRAAFLRGTRLDRFKR